MAIVKPFAALRPAKDKVDKVASLPYDVMNREEAKEMAKGNPLSFLHIVRSEIDLPNSVDAYDKKVYETAKENLTIFEKDGVLQQDAKPMYYVYRQVMDGRPQTGFVACTSIDEYINDTIKKHEFTLPAKEVDRITNFDYCDANTAPIFLTYKDDSNLQKILNNTTKQEPVYNFTTEDDVQHIVWVIEDEAIIEEIQTRFGKIDNLYIADGHHRSASAVKVGLKRREENPNFTGDEEFNFFMAVIFPESDLYIMDYNRVVKDLNDLTEEQLVEKVSEFYNVVKTDSEYKPENKYEIGMYVNKNWYKLTTKENAFDSKHPVKSLDAYILQDKVLAPILNIEDPRTSKRIEFIGGIRGIGELVKRTDKFNGVAFAMYPVTMADIMDVADFGETMPAKSTWFEPKLRSGIFVHKLS